MNLKSTPVTKWWISLCFFLFAEHATPRNIPAWHHVNSKDMLSWGSVRVVHKNAESGQYLLGCWLFEVATCFISFSGMILRCICSNLRMKPKAVRKIESTLNVLRLLLNLQAFVYMRITKYIDKPKESVNPLLLHYWTLNHASLSCSSSRGKRVAQ